MSPFSLSVSIWQNFLIFPLGGNLITYHVNVRKFKNKIHYCQPDGPADPAGSLNTLGMLEKNHGSAIMPDRAFDGAGATPRKDTIHDLTDTI
jgi:hypothetical protein